MKSEKLPMRGYPVDIILAFLVFLACLLAALVDQNQMWTP